MTSGHSLSVSATRACVAGVTRTRTDGLNRVAERERVGQRKDAQDALLLETSGAEADGALADAERARDRAERAPAVLLELGDDRPIDVVEIA